MHKIIVFLSLFILLSCKEKELVSVNEGLQSRSGKNKITPIDINTESEDFIKFISSLTTEKLPLAFSCEVEYLKAKNLNSVYNKYAPKGGSSPIRLITKSSHELIIYHFAADIYFPILYSYTDKGEIIDSLFLINGACNGDPFYNSSCYTLFQSDLIIQMQDTSHHYSFVNENRILDSITLNQDQYKLKPNGKFEHILSQYLKIK